jgi:hypothetical protein
MTRLRRQLLVVTAAALVALLAAFNLRTQYGYLAETAPRGGSTATLMERLRNLRQLEPGRPVLLDVVDPSYPRVIALYTRGHPTMVIAGSPWLGIEDFATRLQEPGFDPRLGAWLRGGSRPLAQPPPSERQFPLPSETPGILEFRRFGVPGVTLDGAVLIAPAADQSIINNSAARPASGRFYALSLSEVHNHLALIDSPLARIVVPGVVENVALWQREPDFANPGQGVQGIGRYLLFQVFNPVAGSRLLLDLTTTSLAWLGVSLPEVAVVGEDRATLHLVGRGAARVLSPPVALRVIDGRSYVAIDMGAEATHIPAARQGVAALFNTDLALDPRRLTGFARNISLLTEDEVRAMTPPAAVPSFPRGLFTPGLLFSGVYEDGWMAEAARFRLQLPEGSGGVRITGDVQGFGALQRGVGITILVDGGTVLARRLDPGDFDLRVPLPRSGDARWVEIRTDAVDRQPGGLLASIRLTAIALESAP